MFVMNPHATLLVVVVVVIGGVSAFPMAVAAETGSSVTAAVGGSTHAQVDGNASDTAANVTAGERLAGVVGVGQAELEGEIDQRAYGIEFAGAATDNARADVVADRLDRIQQRLEELEQEKRSLDEAYANGEIGEGEYNARTAELAARTETVKQLANASEARANSLPAELLEERGINVEAIRTLQQDAENLTGPEVAEIARTIAGDRVGQPISQGPPEDVSMTDRSAQADRDQGQRDAETPTDTGAATSGEEERADRTPTETGDRSDGERGQGG